MLSVHRQEVREENVAHAYNGILPSLEKEGNPATCDNTGGPRGYDAKRNKQVTETQMLRDFI